MTNLDKLIQSIVSYFVPEIDKESLIVRGLVKRTKTKSKQTDIQNTVAGQSWHSDKDKDAWERQIQTKVSQKDLTSIEINSILLAELDLGKAAIIKSAMMAMNPKDTQVIVARRLNQEYGKGYSVSSISPYWKIFTTPLPSE